MLPLIPIIIVIILLLVLNVIIVKEGYVYVIETLGK